MKKQKLKINDDLKRQLKEIHGILEKIDPYPLNDGELNHVKGGCGGTCYVTCAWYCEATCSDSCMRLEKRDAYGIGAYCVLLPTQNQTDWDKRRRLAD